MAKFCNHCHRLYEGDRCNCRRDTTAKRNIYHKKFYDTPAWRSLSRYIRTRDYNMDRLCLYFSRRGRPESKVGVRLHDFLMDATTGQARAFPGVLLVHHIVPREEDYKRQYEIDNLITLNSTVHEYIHQLYGTPDKAEVQRILQDAVQATLP